MADKVILSAHSNKSKLPALRDVLDGVLFHRLMSLVLAVAKVRGQASPITKTLQ